MNFLKENLSIVIVSVILVFVLIFSLTRNNESKITNYPLKDSGPIIVFGDSLAKGVGSKTKPGGFVSRLEDVFNIKILNKGVSGNTTKDGLNRLEKDVLRLNPKLVIIILGGNDFLRKVDKTDTEKSFNEIVSKIHANGSAVLLLGIKTGLIKDDSRKMFERLVANHKTAYIPNLLSGILLKPDLMHDAIHPNDLGYDKITEKITPILGALLK